MAKDAPGVVIKNLIRDAWTDSNVLGIEPYIHHGWLDEENEKYYEVTVSNPEESPVDGGDTGYSGYDPTSGGPVQDVGGTVNVNVWADRNREGKNGNTGNPRQVVYLMKEEVEQILKDHYDATDAGGSQTDLAFLAPQGAERFVEDDETPVRYRYLILAGYGFERR